MTITHDHLDLRHLTAYRPEFARLLPLVEAGNTTAAREARDLFDRLEAIAGQIEADAIALGADQVRTDAYTIVQTLAGGDAVSVALDVHDGLADPVGLSKSADLRELIEPPVPARLPYTTPRLTEIPVPARDAERAAWVAFAHRVGVDVLPTDSADTLRCRVEATYRRTD